MTDNQIEDEVLEKGVKFIERVLHGGEMQERGGNKMTDRELIHRVAQLWVDHGGGDENGFLYCQRQILEAIRDIKEDEDADKSG